LAAGVTAQAGFPWPTSLANVQLLLNGNAVPLTYVSDTQINFLVPSDVPVGAADVIVQTSAGVSPKISINVDPVSPGIFFDSASGFGAILIAGTAQTTTVRPARRGEFVEIYCTGLGQFSALVTIGGIDAFVNFSGLAPGYLGLYQVNAQIPQGVASGAQTLSITVNGQKSNAVKIGVE
jgi:uncharacterized protein (TIGR03437 family)